jgi:acetylornithine deacetylase/succinyl-diaminopimelate desuccinylase-like protein
MQAQFVELGLERVSIDDVHNVYGWLPANRKDAPTLLVSAHTDTVFPAATDLTVRYENGQIFGPGLGDNSLGVAALLTLIEAFTTHNIPRDAHICFVANSREEGLGDLGGMCAVVETLKPEGLNGAIVIEGMALGRVYHSGIAVRRYRLTARCPGGHSWLHFGNPSAIHALVQFGSDFTRLPVPDKPRTTYNIGVIEGGTSVNTIASAASCLLDLRSEDNDALLKLENDMRAIATRLESDDVRFEFEKVGDRPAGSIPADHPLVRLAEAAHEAIDMRIALDSGSTDANIPLSQGIPTVCVGISYGGNAHRLDEYIETTPIEQGMWQLLLLTAAAANAIAGW